MDLFGPQFRKIFIFSKYIQCHPFYWDNTFKLPRLHSSKCHIRLWKLNVFVTSAYATFVFVRCAQSFQQSTSDLLTKMYMTFMSIFYAGAAALQIITVLRHKDMPLMLAQHFEFVNLFYGKSEISMHASLLHKKT